MHLRMVEGRSGPAAPPPRKDAVPLPMKNGEDRNRYKSRSYTR